MKTEKTTKAKSTINTNQPGAEAAGAVPARKRSGKGKAAAPVAATQLPPQREMTPTAASVSTAPAAAPAPVPPAKVQREISPTVAPTPKALVTPPAAPQAKEPRGITPTVAPTTAAAAANPAKAPQAKVERKITAELIAARAYTIWEQQGRPQGRDEANWLLAESQLKQEMQEIQSFTA